MREYALPEVSEKAEKDVGSDAASSLGESGASVGAATLLFPFPPPHFPGTDFALGLALALALLWPALRPLALSSAMAAATSSCIKINISLRRSRDL